jgi:hypothetical protein
LTIESQIEAEMRAGTAKVVEYWEVVLKRLPIYKAKDCSKEIIQGRHNDAQTFSPEPMKDETNQDEEEAAGFIFTRTITW